MPDLRRLKLKKYDLAGHLYEGSRAESASKLRLLAKASSCSYRTHLPMLLLEAYPWLLEAARFASISVLGAHSIFKLAETSGVVLLL